MTNGKVRPELVSLPDSDLEDDSDDVDSVEAPTHVIRRPKAHGHDKQQAIPFGKYMLMGKLGSGGMGVVYHARETFDEESGVQRDLAIKTIRHDSLNASTIELFRQEATMMAQIESDAVVQVRELGTVRGYLKESLVEMPYIAMERILGITLRSLIDQLRKKRIGCPAILAAALIRAAADGLFDLHSLRDPNGNLRRAVHRDVTPRNLMITSKGVVKVIDFGVADAGDWNRRRESVEPYGINAAYLAPELFRNGYLSNKADIFSLCLVFHELLTGEGVFTSKSVFEQYATLEGFSFKPIPSIPKQLNDCLGRMLEKNPDKRPATAKAVAAELQEIVTLHEPRFHNTQICADTLMSLGVDLNCPPVEPLSPSDQSVLPVKQAPRQTAVEEQKEAEIQVARSQGGVCSVRHTIAKHDIDLSFVILENLRSSPVTELVLLKDLPPLQIQLTRSNADISHPGRNTKIYMVEDDPRKSRLNLWVNLGDCGAFYIGHRRTTQLWRVDYYSAKFAPGTSTRHISLKDIDCVLSFQDALDVAIVLRVEPIPRAISLFAIGGRSNA